MSTALERTKIYWKLSDQCSRIHKLMREIETSIEQKHYNLLEIGFDALDKEICNLKEIVDTKKKMERN